MASPTDTRKFRTLFVSDIHLGSKAANTEMLLEFMRRHEAETWYLVGDIVDGWRLKRMWHWPQTHNDVIQKFLRKARKGARIVYVPGNHDEFLRSFPGRHFGGVEVRQQDVHVTADGRKFLVIHGDQFDIVVKNARIIAYLGDWAYDAAIALNTVFNKARRRLGFPYWSFSSWAKLKVKNAVSFIGAFEQALVSEAERKGCHGVICGHIHHAEVSTFEGIEYVNTGDWVESCTAVGEHFDGTLELISFADVLRQEHETKIVHRLPLPRKARQLEESEAA